jgi:hypothetical protein
VLVLAVAAGALFLTLSGGRGSPIQVTLDGVPSENLSGAGVRLLQPDEQPEIDVASAEAAAKAHAPGQGAMVKETVLVRYVNERIKPPADRLAWAVNFDPATIWAVPPLGPGQYAPFCGHPLYHVVFVDARTGDFIAATQRSGDNDADSGVGCPSSLEGAAPTASPGR